MRLRGHAIVPPMTTLLYSHAAFGLHETPPGHPERQSRYGAVEAALAHGDFDDIIRRTAEPAASDRILLAHPQEHFARVSDMAPGEEGWAQLDPDTFMGPHSLDAALRGAGAATAAVDAVMAGEADNAFIIARPPGHHAEQDRAMGFCFFNNAAIAALHAQAAHGCSRVAVVDFDVHHGNGTQAIFWDRENAFFASSHEWPQYPGTGKESDRGLFGQIHNQPMARGEGGDSFRRAWGERLLPALSDFDPDFIVISAGFDAHAADPLGGLELTEEDFAWVTSRIGAIARDKCVGRVISVLEGGYNLDALGNSAAAHLKALATPGQIG